MSSDGILNGDIAREWAAMKKQVADAAENDWLYRLARQQIDAEQQIAALNEAEEARRVSTPASLMTQDEFRSEMQRRFGVRV